MANRGNNQYFKDTSGTSINGTDLSGGSFNTDKIRAKHDWFGVYQEATVSGGTSPTWDWALEISVDGGTTWTNFPDDKESSTQAAMPQITATSDALMFWINPLPNDPNCYIRCTGTTGGTHSTFTGTLKYVTRNTANEMR